MRKSGELVGIYVAIGATLSLLATFSLGFGDVLATLAVLQVIPTLFFASRSRRLPTGMLHSVGLSMACFAVAYLDRQWFTDQGIGLVTTNVLILSGFVSAATGLWLLLRTRRSTDRRAVIGDSIIIGLGSWLVGWVTFVQPAIEQGAAPIVVSVLGGLIFATSSVVLFLMALVLLGERRANAGSWLLALGVVASVASTIVRSLEIAGHIDDSLRAASTALLTLALFAVAGSVLVVTVVKPSIRPVSAVHRAPSATRQLAQLVLTIASLVFPVVVLAASGPNDLRDRVVRSLTALVLTGAVIVRVLESARTNSSAHAELLRRAQTDPLTDLPNRMVLLERISSYLHEAWRPDRQPTLYFVDLDRFKNINDSLGHSAGDEVLRIVAERLVAAAPPEAMVARLSGDEYVVLDPTTRSLDAASSLADRLLAVFREPLALSEGDVFVTASIGVSSITSLSSKPEDVLRHADTAMYRAKDSGRNCMAFYDESMHERIAHRLTVETALYRALDRQELRMFHQPIMDLDTGEVVGFEALMRWQQSDGTIVSPAEFIPIAEETGTIVPIGAWALLDALTQLRRWIDDGVCSPSCTMSVNVSPRQLADPSLPSIVSEALSRSGVDASQLWIEITESVMISEPELALATLQKMKALGVRVALDDFGTGYSSLSLLQRFPLQRIKIDRAFVQGIADNPSDRALVRTIVAMAQSLGLDLVAEGVESLHQMDVLSELGCTKAQGYLISHPVPADAMRSTVSALQRLGRFPLLRGEHRAGQL
jgi:diguanylate cyclase (GGDEF)-like protein